VFDDQPDDVRITELLRDRCVCLLRGDYPALDGRLTLRRLAALDPVHQALRQR